MRTTYADKLKKLKESSRSGAPSVPATPATGVFPFLLSQSSFMILITHLQTQNARPISHVISPLIHAKDPEQIASLRRPQPTHHYHLILTHRPYHDAQRQTFPRRLCVCRSLHHPSMLFSPFNAASNPPKKPASAPPPKATSNPTTSPQTHHDRQQREGNSHTAHLFRRGLCRGAVQVRHGCVGGYV